MRAHVSETALEVMAQMADDIPLPAEPDDLPSRPPLGDRVLTVSQLAGLRTPTPLVDGLVYRGTLAQLSASAGSYKSFAAVAIACSVALGMDLDDFRVPSAERVLYVAAEGASGLRARILAWCELNRADVDAIDDQLLTLPEPVQLRIQTEVDDLCQFVREQGIGLVIIDTRSKSTLGLDENSNTEQARAVAAAERIVEANGCAVLVIHHNGRSGSTPRGATAWDGGVWSDLRMEGAEMLATITCHKHKDAASQCRHQFRLVAHTVSEDLMPGVTEDSRKSLVFFQNRGWKFGAEATSSDKAILEVVWKSAPPEGLTPPKVVELVQETKKLSQSTVYSALKRLADNGKVKNLGTDKRSRYAITALGQQEVDE